MMRGVVTLVVVHLFAVASAGACSSDEQAALLDPATVGKAEYECSLAAYNVLTDNVNHDKFNDCFTGKLSIGATCSDCYATSSEYVAKNCKSACLLGWATQGCLDCEAAAKLALDACTGFISAVASAGACSSDEQAALLDPAIVGKAESDCSLAAYNLLTGNFNHDKFNDCFTGELSIGAICSDCYATSSEYVAKNCKSACLLGWSTQGCLDCEAAPKPALDACTGFISGSVEPFESEQVISTHRCGSGMIVEDLSDATFTLSVTDTETGLQLASCVGDGVDDLECWLPLRQGSFTMLHQEFPIAAGELQICGDLTLAPTSPMDPSGLMLHVEVANLQSETVISLDLTDRILI